MVPGNGARAVAPVTVSRVFGEVPMRLWPETRLAGWCFSKPESSDIFGVPRLFRAVSMVHQPLDGLVHTLSLDGLDGRGSSLSAER